MRCRAATIAGATCLALASPLPLAAGPWSREDGTVFLSFSLSGEETQTNLMLGQVEPDRFASLYAEYGLGHGLTAGLDIGYGEVSQMTVGYLRYTFTAPDARLQLAVDGGLGGRWQDGADTIGLARLGASVGYGFGEWSAGVDWLPLGHDGGWMTLEATTLTDIETGDVIWQTEGTLGLHIGERFRVAFALKVEEWPDAELTVTARPSVIYSFSDRTPVQLGAVAGLEGSEAVGLSLSLWQQF